MTTQDKKHEDTNAIKHPSDVIGEFGPLQRNIIIYLILIYIISPFNASDIVFTAPKADFYCVDSDPVTGLQVNLTNSCFIKNNSSFSNETSTCEVFDHDRTFHERTLINTFDLVCDKSWFPSFAQSLHQLGFAVSGLLLGIVSDKFGRFFCAKFTIVLEIIAGFGEAFAPNIYCYFIARFFIGFASYGRFLNGYVLIAEWVGPKIRGKMAAVYEIGWCTGDLMLPWVYYFVPDYFKVKTTVSTIEIFLLVGYVLVVEESPRWLLTHGKFDKAEKVMKKAAEMNGVVDEKDLDRKLKQLREFTIREQEMTKETNVDKTSLFDIWKDKGLLKTSVILYYSWFCLALSAYGSFLNIGNLGGSLHVNVFINAVSGLISIFLLYLVIRKFDRRSLLRYIYLSKILFLLGLLSCAFDDNFIPGRIVFFSLSGIASWLEYGVVYVYTTEFFPTTTRQTAIGICSLFARFGSMVAPFIKELTNATHLAVPFTFFIILSLTNVILLMFLPNTTDIELPDTVLQSKKKIND